MEWKREAKTARYLDMVVCKLAFPSSEEGASILMNNSDKDRVLFKNISGSGQTCGGGTLNATEVAEINATVKT